MRAARAVGPWMGRAGRGAVPETWVTRRRGLGVRRGASWSASSSASRARPREQRDFTVPTAQSSISATSAIG